MERDPRARGAASRSRTQPTRRNPPPRRQPPRAHRITAAERRRKRFYRAFVGFLLVAIVLVVGVVISINLLFKVQNFRVENMDGTTPADTGPYSEAQILDLLAVQEGENLIGIPTGAKARTLSAQLPYLEEVRVHISLPSTVVVRVRPAVERFALQQPNGFLILSEQLKILRVSDMVPNGTIVLETGLSTADGTETGQTAALLTHDSLQSEEESEGIAANDTLNTLLLALERQGLMEGVTRLTLLDVSELSFVYENRVTVQLGTTNSLDDKLYIAARALLDVNGEGLGVSDRGTLRFYQDADGVLRAYFRASDTPIVTPEPTEPGDGDAPDGMTDPPDDDTLPE